MNGRVYDPLLGRFGTPDPMTEDPFSTQGWNRYAYVGNSPLNFTDPSGYCFLGCFWKPLFKAIGNFFKTAWRSIVQVAATALLCTGPLAPVCAGVIAFTVTGVTSGDLGLALRAGVTAAFTAFAMDAVGTATLGQGHPMPEFLSPAHLRNIAGHALVGCASAVMGGAKCGPGALSAAVGSFAGPILKDLGAQRNLVARAVVGGVASVAAGDNFANGAVTAAFGYLFNEAALLTKRDSTGGHSALFIWNDGQPVLYDPAGGYPGTGDPGDGTVGGVWGGDSASVEAYKKYYKDQGYDVDVTWLNTSKADVAAMVKWLDEGPSRAAPFFCARSVSTCLQQAPSMKGLDRYWLPYSLKGGAEKYKLPLP